MVSSSSLAEELSAGDSLAVNGVCLTVILAEKGEIQADVGPETVRVTTLGAIARGAVVNLERPLRADGRLGGHFVQGHVDGVGTVVSLDGTPEAKTLRVRMPSEVARYVVEKGFIAVDGISLTVTDVADSTFAVAVIPYTLEHTVLGERSPGDSVNLEVDIVAKYVERLLAGGVGGSSDG